MTVLSVQPCGYAGCEECGRLLRRTHDCISRRRGCAVDCSIHSLNRLAYLEDVIFENLPAPLYLDWPQRFISAPKPGTDLSLVVPRFMVWLLTDPADGVIRFAGEPKWKVVEAIKKVPA